MTFERRAVGRWGLNARSGSDRARALSVGVPTLNPAGSSAVRRWVGVVLGGASDEQRSQAGRVYDSDAFGDCFVTDFTLTIGQPAIDFVSYQKRCDRGIGRRALATEKHAGNWEVT